jgi:hypothetical protein
LTVDAPRNWLTVRLIEAFDDRATLAAEVARLTRLHEARPPYVMSQWEPAELDELLARDTALWQTGTLAANQSETGFGGIPIVESDAVPDGEIRIVAVNDDGQLEVVGIITDIDVPAETREDVT